jgi:choice-of-anchor A domain-containing protein
VDGTGPFAGKLTIYMDGPSFSMNGAAVVDGGSAASLAYYGTTNNTSVTLSGNAAFTGTIYAPEADIKLGGGGNNTYDMVGAIIGNTITMNGHFNFHFDENLITAGPSRGYVANSWREL